MLFARWVFAVAGVYGLLVLVPQYFMERQVTPPVAHPEFFYGFLGVAVAWQVAFLMIASDPSRYRPLMIASVLEKLSFAVAVIVLYSLGRVPGLLLGFGALDLMFGILFSISFLLCPGQKRAVG